MNLYTEYHTNSLSQNVFGSDYLVSAGTWGATASGLSDYFHGSTWDNSHNAWIGKQYYRRINPPTNSLPNPTMNIALNKPTSSSSSENAYPSSNAVDGNRSLNNYWKSNPYAQWWQVDLEDVYNVSKIVVINYYDGNRYYQYDIQASTDGVNWTKIVDFNNNTTPSNSEGNNFESLNTAARYLRVNMNFNSASVGVHIIEFEVYNKEFPSKN